MRIHEIVGLAFGQVRFVSHVKHGKHTRQVELDCSAEKVLQLADAIRGCQQVYEDPKTGARPRDMGEVRSDSRFEPVWIEHALWHLRNPEHLMPCLPHDTQVIDVDERLVLTHPRENADRIVMGVNRTVMEERKRQTMGGQSHSGSMYDDVSDDTEPGMVGVASTLKPAKEDEAKATEISKEGEGKVES